MSRMVHFGLLFTSIGGFCYVYNTNEFFTRNSTESFALLFSSMAHLGLIGPAAMFGLKYMNYNQAPLRFKHLLRPGISWMPALGAGMILL